MGIVRDILDLVDTVRDTDVEDIFDASKRSKYSTTSIARKTSDLVCVFPVMVSSSLSIDTAIMNMKAIERKCATMLQLLFSADQVQNSSDLSQILGQFQKNIKLNDKMTVDDVVAVMDRLNESGLTMRVNPALVEAVKEDMKNINFYFERNVNPQSLNEFEISRNKSSRETIVERYGSSRPNRTDGSAITKAGKDLIDTTRNAYISTDYKKANEMVPTLITVNFYAPAGDTNAPVAVGNVVIGVKARLIPVASNDIVNHIMAKVDDRNILLQFIRATTRETNFVKDFLLAIDRAKIDALAHSRKGSANPMWKVLERRAMGSRLKRLIGSNNNYMAITSLIISQEDVDYIKKEYNVNVEDPSTVYPLFSNYNLLCFGISDESLEVAKFMFDTGEGNWENYSFTSLEREDKDNTYKKVVNLMTKVAR